MKVRCFNIDWDTDGESLEDCGLPTECVLELDTEFLEMHGGEDDIADELADKLSDQYGFCHYGFEYEIVKEQA